MKVGIINVTGYAGVELARILHAHPEVTITSLTARSRAGHRVGEVFPHLSALDLRLEEGLSDSVDVVFSALPHGASAERVAPLLNGDLKAVDISADFRLKDAGEYQEWYGGPHPRPELLEEAVYGLPELNREEVASARLVANPGCYSTAAILALAPAVRAGVIGPDVIIDAKSGVSGAGRGLSLRTHFSEVNESVSAYSVGGHRHLPEVTQELGRLDGSGGLKVTMLTHLIPMTRGILVSCYAPLLDEDAVEAVGDIYADFYRSCRSWTPLQRPSRRWGATAASRRSIQRTRRLRLGRPPCSDCQRTRQLALYP